MKYLNSFLVAILSLILPSCSYDFEYYKNSKINADFRDIFSGKIEGHGMIFDFKGRMSSSFSISMDGKWIGDKGVLDEVFKFNDGKLLNRKWEVEYFNNNQFFAKAEDVEGVAQGKQSGNVVETIYELMVPFRDSQIKVSAKDLVYQIDKNVVFSVITLRKFGFKVGEIIIYMKKLS
jgi:antitoxin component YwqK of YwqJK toxin-antitoxin module